MSTVFDILGRQNNQSYQQPVQNGNRNMASELMNFMQTFQGNPEQIVRNLISSGRMTRQQFEQLSRQASDIQRMFNIH